MNIDAARKLLSVCNLIKLLSSVFCSTQIKIVNLTKDQIAAMKNDMEEKGWTAYIEFGKSVLRLIVQRAL